MDLPRGLSFIIHHCYSEIITIQPLQVFDLNIRDHEKLKNISGNLKSFALKHFKASSLLCWTALTILHLESIEAFEPEVLKEMVEMKGALTNCLSC